MASNLFVLPTFAIGADGTLYLGSNNGFVLALNASNGQSKANTSFPVRVSNTNRAPFNSPNSMYTSPAIGPDGTIYIGSNEGYLSALDPSGNIKWRFLANYPLQSSPMIDSTGTIYFAAGPIMYAIGDARYKGYPKWLTPFLAGANIVSSPALGQNGYLYFGSCDGNVYAVNSFTGLIVWSYPTSAQIYASPTVDSFNNVIIGNGSKEDGTLYYIDGAMGSLLWSSTYDLADGPYYNTVAVVNNTIYSSTIAYVYAINRVDGAVLWRFNKSNFYFTAPIVDASGTILVASIDALTNYGLIQALTPAGKEKWRYTTGVVGRLAPPVLGSDGTIYVSSTANKIYAVR